MSQSVVMYTTRFCPFCIAARRLLKSKGVDFADIPVDGDARKRAEIAARSGQRTVPQVWVGERHVGGFDELSAADRSGDLDQWLSA